jgi:hypothetical protein
MILFCGFPDSLTSLRQKAVNVELASNPVGQTGCGVVQVGLAVLSALRICSFSFVHFITRMRFLQTSQSTFVLSKFC